mmetsp:Transcript_25452/g.39894  ORF Transcript_25452/g.39894 Transcript_25452/m.39894 type:complete len:83 (-) Transcript_25452:137-385(-)
MPQLLDFLQVSERKKGSKPFSYHELDFGTLAVYSCAQSCSTSEGPAPTYQEEFVWKQPGIDSDFDENLEKLFQTGNRGKKKL